MDAPAYTYSYPGSQFIDEARRPGEAPVAENTTHFLQWTEEFAKDVSDNANEWANAATHYPQFVAFLFKQMPMLWPQDVQDALDRWVNECSANGKSPDIPPFIVRNMLRGLTNATGTAMHASIGIAGEGGELLDAAKKAFIYRREWDLTNVLEELGDLRFYYQAWLNLLGLTDEDVKAANYVKLRERYKTGRYSDAQAQARADKVVSAEVQSPGEVAQRKAVPVPPAVTQAVQAAAVAAEGFPASLVAAPVVVGTPAAELANKQLQEARTLALTEQQAWLNVRAALLRQAEETLDGIGMIEADREQLMADPAQIRIVFRRQLSADGR